MSKNMEAVNPWRAMRAEGGTEAHMHVARHAGQHISTWPGRAMTHYRCMHSCEASYFPLHISCAKFFPRQHWLNASILRKGKGARRAV